MNNENRVVRIAEDFESLSEAAASVFVASVMAHDPARDFTVALAGGNTPRRMHEILSTAPHRDAIPWGRVRFLWGDERCVPPDHAESNYGMARQTLLDKIPHDPSKVHRMHGEEGPNDGSTHYAELVAQHAIVARGEHGDPAVDLIYLGIGDDGHTASLFPYTLALHDREHHVAPGYNKKLSSHRITFTPRMINAARLVVFVVTGASKAPMLRRILEEPGPIDEAPSRVVKPVAGQVLWLVDRAAAAQLSPALTGG